MAPLVHRWAISLLLGIALLPIWAGSAVPGSQRPELVVADATASPTTLDPFKVYGTQAQSFFRLIFEPLFDRDPDGKIRTPILERWGPVDQLTWEFRLRSGVRFHDGGELTAADVVYSLGRILDPGVNSPRRHEFGELDTIVAVDPLTVRITTKRPYALLPARLSQFSMLLPDQLRGRSEAVFFQDPIGLGPFRLSQLDSKQAVLTAFAELLRRRAQGPDGCIPVHPRSGGSPAPAAGGKCRYRHESPPPASRVLATRAGRPPAQAQLYSVHGCSR